MSGKGVMVGTKEEIAREIARKLSDERRGYAEPCDEFLKFRKLLDGAGIPWHDASEHIEGDSYSYHMHRTHGDGFSVIYGIGSYGREAGLLEARVEGTPDVTGWLTAEKAFEMVKGMHERVHDYKVHGLKRPIPYRLAESELCSYENARDECVCMGDYLTVFCGYGPDGAEVEATGELWGVMYGHGGFIEEVELVDKYGDGHRRAFLCEGVFLKAERPGGAIELAVEYRVPASVTGKWEPTRGWVCANCNYGLHAYPCFCPNCGGLIDYEKHEDEPKAVLD